jgi:hypothetical protein
LLAGALITVLVHDYLLKINIAQMMLFSSSKHINFELELQEQLATSFLLME